MYTYEHTVNGTASLAKVWELYSDVSKWSAWDKGVKSVELSGAFTEGSQGVMEMVNGQKLPFSIRESNPGLSFSICSQMGPISISFDHILQEVNGTVTITHTVMIDGGDEQEMEGMGKGITASIPGCLECLISLAK
jgi:hypothetical protein